MNRTSSGEHILKQPWPSFLDGLSDNPATAMQQFADFAYRILRTRPPRILDSLPHEQREDYVQDIVMHFLADGAEILQRYRNTGKPFSSWFIVVATRKAYDLYRRDSKRSERESSLDEQVSYQAARGNAVPPDEQSGLRDVLDKVAACMLRMTPKCQILLQAAAEDYEPKEMVALLPGELRDNKHASDTLRACRKRLRAMLADYGVDPAEYFGVRAKEKSDE